MAPLPNPVWGPTENPAERGEKETGRVEAFSDGVFAIAITLLILELKIPKGASGKLPGLLVRQWPTFLAYLTSFATILVMWVNHHKLFTHIRRTTGAFLFLNGLLLLFVTETLTGTVLRHLPAAGHRVNGQTPVAFEICRPS